MRHLQQRLSLEALLLSVEFDAQLGKELFGFFLFEFHDGIEKLVDGIEDEHAETTHSTDAFLGLPFLFL